MLSSIKVAVAVEVQIIYCNDSNDSVNLISYDVQYKSLSVLSHSREAHRP